MLSDAEKWLATRLKDTKAAREKADEERKRLQGLLGASADERATRAAALLRKKNASLDEIQALATGAGDPQLQVIPQLKALAALQVPALEEIEAIADRLRAAAQAAAQAATAIAELTQQRVELLQAALRFHEHAGDVDCPVCGQGRLDAEWAVHARDTVADANAALAEYRSATEELKVTRSAALNLLQQLPSAAEVDGVDRQSLAT